jgi:hypothetical protein
MIEFAQIPVETMSVQELKALASYQQAEVLNEIAAEVLRVNAMAKHYDLELAAAQKAVIMADSSASAKVAKCQAIDAKTALKILKDRAASLKHVSTVFRLLLEHTA